MTLVIAAALLAGLVGLLVALEVRHSGERIHVDVAVDTDAAWRHDGQWYVPITATNDGDRTTDLLRVRVEQSLPNGEVEETELEWNFVAGGEQVEGIAVFEHSPVANRVDARAVAVTRP